MRIEFFFLALSLNILKESHNITSLQGLRQFEKIIIMFSK